MDKLIIILALASLACGAQALPTQTPQLSIKNPAIDTSTQPATQTSTAVMTVCNSGGLNIRPKAGDLSRSDGWKNDGDPVTVLLPAIVAPDMGLWYELLDGGFVNSRFLCNSDE